MYRLPNPWYRLRSYRSLRWALPFILLVMMTIPQAVTPVYAMDCIITIGSDQYVVPGCDEHPDPSSPGFGI